MQEDPKTAREVTEDLLARSQTAFLTDDFSEFADCMGLPYRIETFDGHRLLDTRDQLQDLFLAVRAHHRKTGVTDMDRHVVEAEFQDPATIATTFETRLLNGNVLTQKPYPVFSIIKLINGKWQVTNMSFAIDDNDDHNAALLSSGT